MFSSVKHPNIIMLMAASYNKKLINHMILVLEPMEFTLNYFLHQMVSKIVNILGEILKFVFRFLGWKFIPASININCTSNSKCCTIFPSIWLCSFKYIHSLHFNVKSK